MTREDVQRVAKEHLHPSKAVILMVGDEKDIELGDPKHPFTFKDLSSGPLVQVPLRDPLTMDPLPAESR